MPSPSGKPAKLQARVPQRCSPVEVPSDYSWAVARLKAVVGENYGSLNHYQRFHLVMLFDEERIGSGS